MKSEFSTFQGSYLQKLYFSLVIFAFTQSIEKASNILLVLKARHIMDVTRASFCKMIITNAEIVITHPPEVGVWTDMMDTSQHQPEVWNEWRPKFDCGREGGVGRIMCSQHGIPAFQNVNSLAWMQHACQN